MSYDKTYYENRKQELEDEWNLRIQRSYQRLANVFQETQNELADIQKKVQDLMAKETAAKKLADDAVKTTQQPAGAVAVPQPTSEPIKA